MGIFIGEETARGKGYAKLAIKQILKYGFESLNFHRIYLTVMNDITSALYLNKDIGFTQEEIMRESYHKNNMFIDIIIVSIHKNEWEERV